MCVDIQQMWNVKCMITGRTTDKWGYWNSNGNFQEKF